MDILIYIKNTCPYCRRAKQLLEDLGQTYTEVDVLTAPNRRDEMIEKAHGNTTVPQIFIGEKHIGGCDDLYALHEKGALESLLK